MANISSSPFSVAIVDSTALSRAATALKPGESANVTPNSVQSPFDIQWSLATVFYDAARLELQHMGKPASSQPNGTEYSHYLYSELMDKWTAVAKPQAEDFGHIWSYAFDPATGDYYYSISNSNGIRRFRRADGVSAKSWIVGADTGPTTAGQTLSSGGLGAAILGWHPNLFASGVGGVFALGAFRAFAYNPATDQWSLLMNETFASGSEFRNRSNGQAIYLPGPDRLVIFGKSQDSADPDYGLWLEAGAGASTNIINDGLFLSSKTSPPIRVVGGGGKAVHGHVTTHPDDPNRLLLLEEHGTSRVWDSTDFGATWSSKNYTHPFQEMLNASAGEYIVGTIAPYGVVVGMTSNNSGGESVIWKPDD